MTCRELLSHFMRFNTLMGLPLFVIPRSRLPLTLFSIYVRLSEIIVFFGVLGQFWAVPYISHDMNVLCACLASGTHSLQIILKTALLHSMRGKFEKYFVVVDESLAKTQVLQNKVAVLRSPIINFVDFFNVESRTVRFILTSFFLMTVASTSSYFIPLDITSISEHGNLTGQVTPIVFYFHFDFMYTPAFQIVNLFLTACFFLVNLKTVVTDSFILAFIVLLTIQHRYLKMILGKIVEGNSSKIGIGNMEEEKMLVTGWVKEHQRLLRISYQLREMLSPFLLLEFGYIFIHTCVPSFVITSTLSWNVSQKSAVFFIMGAGLCQLFFMSQAGDYLTEAVEDTTKVLYRFKIFKKEEEWQRLAYNMAAVRRKIQFKLKAASLFPLCCSTFVTILRMILSYYLALNEVQQMKQDTID